MAGIKKRLQGLSPTIKKILEVAGATGASLGVIHHNEVVHLESFGYRDLAAGLAPDEHTIYHIASLSKSFTSSSLARLDYDGKLSLQDPVSSILPNFTHPDKNVHNHATVLDFLSHRTGLATKQSLWQQFGPELLLQEHDAMGIVSYLDVVKPLGTWFNYNNYGYDVGAEVLEKVSGKPWDEIIENELLKPLKLDRTFVSNDIPQDNYAKGYMPSPQGEVTDVGRPVIGSRTIQKGANGVKTTVSDLLRYYSAVLQTYKEEDGDVSNSSSSPLRGVTKVLTGHIDLDDGSSTYQKYGAGWAIVDLPAPVGAMGTNGMFVSEMPLLGKGTQPKKLWYHNGSLVGFFSSVHILPDSDTIVVVLVNSIPKNDAPDWIGQLLIETILDNDNKNDYVSLAEESAKAYDDMWAKLPKELDDLTKNKKIARPLEEYTGRFYNKPRNWFIEVILERDDLAFSFQGRSSQKHSLSPIDTDTFSWPVSEVESRERARWPDLDAPMYVFNFEEDSKGNISGLRWAHDPDIPGGEIFQKMNASAARQSESVHAEL